MIPLLFTLASAPAAEDQTRGFMGGPWRSITARPRDVAITATFTVPAVRLAGVIEAMPNEDWLLGLPDGDEGLILV